MPRFKTYQEELSWRLEEKVNVIERSSARYNVNVTYPEYSLPGQSLGVFNAAISGDMEAYVRDFTVMAGTLALPDGAISELKGTHSTFTAVKRFITAKVDLYPYLGGAHPAHEIWNATFDTFSDTVITLSQFFRDDTVYLEKLSVFVEKSLHKKYPELQFAFEDLSYRKGFGPEEENFAHWALRGDQLIIFFPEFQVAPYAAGTLHVAIPFANIANISMYDW